MQSGYQKFSRRLLAAALLALAAAAAAFGGSLKVTVRFALPSGELQPLPGATVTVQPPAGKALQSFTDDAGTVEFADVASGECLVQAEMEGFRTIRKKVGVTAAAPAAVEIELPLEQLSTSVDVVAESDQEKLKAPQLPEELQQALLKVAPLVNEMPLTKSA